MFARARTWGFLEAGSATFGETVTLSVNGESITVDDFSYMRLANAINDVRGTSGVGAYAEDWGVQIEDWSGGDIRIEQRDLCLCPMGMGRSGLVSRRWR